ncbi:MAG: formate dehydrogenase accessory sulfurtransferase FdhD [Pontibacterium sp.]
MSTLPAIKGQVDQSEKPAFATRREITVNRWQQGDVDSAQDWLAEEVPVALVYNGISHVVMMSSPGDLQDFALGFSLTEGIIEHPGELYAIEPRQHDNGIELELTIATRRLAALKQQRRNLTGRTGCGLCGAESLGQVIRTSKPLPPQTAQVSHAAVQRAVSQLDQHQPLQAQTGAAHGAAWCDLKGQILLVREDVGRHNALDKLIGALHKTDTNLKTGFVLISSRASYEIIQKTTAVGIPALVAVSAPTALALEQARAANLQLIGFARPRRHVRYTP